MTAMNWAYDSNSVTRSKKAHQQETDGLDAIVVVFVLQVLCQQGGLLQH